VTIILARFILKEKIEKFQILGISITFIGIVGISTNEKIYDLLVNNLSNLLN
jgi:drug/metabolite transporter (DMT)-like permease